MKAECIVTGGKQKHKCLEYWNPSLHEAWGPVYFRVNTHRIYMDRDYVKFTQDKIYSDWCRLQYINFHPLSTASKFFLKTNQDKNFTG